MRRPNRSITWAALAGAAWMPLALSASTDAGQQDGAKPSQEDPAPQEGKGDEKPADDAKPPVPEEPRSKDEEAKEPKRDDSKIDELNPFRQGGGADPQQEMRELFLKVDKRLNRVTELLFEASAGDTSRADDIGSAGIDELIREAESQAGGARSDIARLLEASRAQSEAASGEIGRILEIAEQNQSSSSSSSSSGQQQGQPQSSGQPQQGQTPQGSRREDKGETGPEGESQGQQPQPQQEGEGEQNQDQEGDGKPTGDQESNQTPDQQKGDNPPESETGDAANASGNENWGELPVHLRRVFENSVSDDVPARYRDWVDSYYKRLGQRSGR